MSARKIKPPHEIKIINSIPRLVKENFTIRFTSGTQAPLWMQEGGVFDESGNEVSDVPDWVWEEYAKCSDDAKKRLGMTVPAAGKAK